MPVPRGFASQALPRVKYAALGLAFATPHIQYLLAVGLERQFSQLLSKLRLKKIVNSIQATNRGRDGALFKCRIEELASFQIIS